jgi:hypothetical protein
MTILRYNPWHISYSKSSNQNTVFIGYSVSLSDWLTDWLTKTADIIQRNKKKLGHSSNTKIYSKQNMMNLIYPGIWITYVETMNYGHKILKTRGYNSVISKVIFNKSWLLTLIMLYYYFLLIKMSIIITPVLFFLLLTCQKLSIKISIIDFMILLIIFFLYFLGVILHNLQC